MNKMHRSMTALILAGSLALALCSGPGSAAAEEGMADSSTVEITDGETGYTYTVYEENAGEESAAQRAEITGYTGSGTVLTIPAKVGGYQVGSIGTGAFKGNTDITAVTVSEGITRMGYEAFQGCEGLASVTLPTTITDWSDDWSNNYESKAFQGCTALKELALPEGLTSLGQCAFADCSLLEQLTIPSTIKTFRDKVFENCTSLRELELKEGIKQIGYRAFRQCTSLEEVVIPSTIESWPILNSSGIMAAVYDCAPFADCTSLRKITFREGLKTLRGFQGCRGCPLVKELDIPASVENIAYAFTDCASLEKVTLHDGMDHIGTNAFKGCAALQEVNVPNTVTTIMANAFSGCAALERLVFPPATTGLEGGVTGGCTSLKELYLLANAVKWYQALGLSSEGKLYCVEGSGTYNTYAAGMPESTRQKLTAIPTAGAEAEGGSFTYDGSPHQAVTVRGVQEGDEVLYRLNEGRYQEEIPQVTEPGSYTVEIMVKRLVSGEPMRYSGLRVQTLVSKRQYSMQLSDVEVTEGDGYTVNLQGYQGDEEPVFSYYKDRTCSQVCDGKPEAAGVYYVKAYVEETDHDLAVESNVAKITILAKENPGGDIGTDPGSSSAPESSSPPDSGSQTDSSPNPGTVPDASVSPVPGSSASPRPEDGASPTPGGSPSPKPGGSASPTPGVNASQAPGNGSGQTPGVSASSQPGTRPTAKPDATGKKVKVGKVSLKKVTSPKKKSIKAVWKKQSGITGYQVCAALDKKMKKGKKQKKVKGASKTTGTLKKLKSRKRYYVRVRAYKTVGGKTYYGSWSKMKKIRVK